MEISMTVRTIPSFQLRTRSAEAQARQARSQKQSFLSSHHLPYLLPHPADWAKPSLSSFLGLLQLCSLSRVTVVTLFCSSQPRETPDNAATPTKVIMTCVLCSITACLLPNRYKYTNTPSIPGVRSQLDDIVLHKTSRLPCCPRSLS